MTPEGQLQIQESELLLFTILTSGNFHTSSAKIGKSIRSDGEVSYFSTNVACKELIENYEEAGADIARIVMRTFPTVLEKDYLSVSFTYGFDIGIASA